MCYWLLRGNRPEGYALETALRERGVEVLVEPQGAEDWDPPILIAAGERIIGGNAILEYVDAREKARH